MKLDPVMHIGLHLVFFGKSGVTVMFYEEIRTEVEKECGSRLQVEPRHSISPI
jgi:hypothetical protein